MTFTIEVIWRPHYSAPFDVRVLNENNEVAFVRTHIDNLQELNNFKKGLSDGIMICTGRSPNYKYIVQGPLE